jgi:adenosylhomocysteine nucleosidase
MQVARTHVSEPGQQVAEAPGPQTHVAPRGRRSIWRVGRHDPHNVRSNATQRLDDNTFLARAHIGASTLVVVGLAREARLFKGSSCIVVVAGSNYSLLLATLAQAATPAVTEVVSFGLAGGLRPGLRPGALILASQVFDGVSSYQTDPDWRVSLHRAVPHAHSGDLAGVGEIIARTPAKAALFHRTGAAAADMESHIVARFAQDRNLRFAAIRAVADSAESAVPSSALVATRADGGVDLAAVRRSIVREPSQIGPLIRLGFEAAAGMRTLKRTVDALLAS